MKSICSIIGALVVAAALASPATVKADDKFQWEEIGCVKVGDGQTQERIAVGDFGGLLKALRVRAKGNDIAMEHVVVISGNRDTDGVRVPYVLHDGEETKPHDFGKERLIVEIDVAAQRDPKSSSQEPATLCIYGLTADGIF